MSLLLALLPVLVSCLLILVWRYTAITASLAGVAAALTISILSPSLHIAPEHWRPLLTDTGSLCLNIGMVLLGGVFLYQSLSAGRGLQRIADWVQSRIAGEVHCLLVVVFGVGLFFESTTGFGVGILVTAPLLLALGYAPLNAAFLALLGQCGVTWGALAIGTIIGAQLSGLPSTLLSLFAVPLSLPFLCLCGLAAMTVAGLWRRYRTSFLLLWLFAYVAVVAALLCLCTYLFGVELAGCLAGAGVVIFGLLVSGRVKDGAAIPIPWRSLLPFVVLVTGLLVSRLVTPVRQLLQTVTIGEFTPFYHAGFWLMSAVVVVLVLLPGSRQRIAVWITAALVQWGKALLAVCGFLLLGQLMKYSGMTSVLAESASLASGKSYAWFAPALGALGGFLTASNASSNALFMEFQVKTAGTVGMPVELVASVQSVAGSNATLASPGRVVFAASIVGEDGAESTLLRRAIPIAVGGALGTALLTDLYWRLFA